MPNRIDDRKVSPSSRPSDRSYYESGQRYMSGRTYEPRYQGDSGLGSLHDRRGAMPPQHEVRK